MNKKILITGSSGLVGSEAAEFFSERGYNILGIDDNSRAKFFGPDGDTLWNLERLKSTTKNFQHYNVSITDRSTMLSLVEESRPDAVLHCAAQPSHDLAAQIPFDDFDVNAGGTLNLLEACRRFVPEAPFVFLSTNKVYGDNPNKIAYREEETRYVLTDPHYEHGISEKLSVDQNLHSLFGASKLAADIMVQEYGRYFNMPTCCFRAGCITGSRHSGAKLHGFLSYLVKCAYRSIPYTIIGYKGKQVRDQIHARDLIRCADMFITDPKPASVYNIGGGMFSNASVLECVRMVEEATGKKMQISFEEKSRIGDHRCYVSNLNKIQQDFPKWDIQIKIPEIINETIKVLREGA